MEPTESGPGSRAAYEQETAPLLRQRVRAFAGTFAFFMGIGVAIECLNFPERQTLVLSVYAAEVAVCLAAIGAMGWPFTRRFPRAVGAIMSALLAAVARHLGDRVEVAGANAGLHLLLWLRGVPARETPRLIARAARAGVGVYAPDPFYLGHPPGAGLVLGYASLDEDAIREGIRRLARSL